MNGNKIFVVVLIMCIGMINFDYSNQNKHHPVFVNIKENKIKSILIQRNAPKDAIPRLTELYLNVPDAIRNDIMDIHYIESRYDSLAHSYTGDYGLGQINHSIWKEPLDSLYKADYNTNSTIDKYTKALKTANGNKYVALYIYNGNINYLKRYEKLWNVKLNLNEIKELRFKKRSTRC